MACVVGIMAHDEGANIAAALRSVLSQTGPHVGNPRVVVVASGCTDDTVRIARGFAASHPRVAVVEQARREGKAAAVNLFLAEAGAATVCVLAGGDTRLEPGALEALVAPFDDPAVGMTGGRPMPVNARDRILGRVVHLQWDLHDAVARIEPKLGELVAFRPVVGSLPPDTATDEAWLESAILASGRSLVYVPEAKVAMRGPGTFREFIAQRRRIHAGHLRLAARTGHRVSTIGRGRAASEALRLLTSRRTTIGTIPAAAVLETWARLLGAWDARIARREHAIWTRLASTKDLRG
jgi:cellulose synthase/poly-beta-1,6-N-acetylglucosamine synthase-like glycosyltransferase